MEQHIRTIFGILGLSFENFTPVYMGFEEGADALVAGDIDVQFHPPIPNKVLTDLSQRAEIRVIPFASGQMEKLLAQVSFYRPVVVRKNAFRGVMQDITQVGVINVIVTHERVDQSAVRDMDRQPRQAAQYGTVPFSAVRKRRSRCGVLRPAALEYRGADGRSCAKVVP